MRAHSLASPRAQSSHHVAASSQPTCTPHLPHRKRRCAGFTLVEVMVALTVMAIMAVMAWRGIDGITRAQTATQRYTNDVMTLQAGLSQWRADLDAMISWPTENGTLPNTEVHRRSLLWDGQVLRITRMLTDQPTAGLCVVAWTRRSSDGQWMRWQSPPVLSHSAWQAAWEQAARWAQTAPQQPLSPHDPATGAQAVSIATLQNWQLQYFRNNAWANPLSSAAEGPTQTNTLPDGVRLIIHLASGQSLSGAVQLDWVRPDFGGAQ